MRVLIVLLFLMSLPGTLYSQPADLAIPYLKQKKYGLCDVNKNAISNAVYDSIVIANALNRLFVVANKSISQKYGVIDKQGNVVVPVVYDSIYILSEHFAIVKKKDKGHNFFKTGVYNSMGKMILPVTYDSIRAITNFDKQLFFVLKKDHGTKKYQEGVIDDKNQLLIPFSYDYIMLTSSNELNSPKNPHGLLFIAEKINGKKKSLFYIDCDGKFIKPPVKSGIPEQQELSGTPNELRTFKNKEGKFGITDNERIIISPQYDSLIITDAFRFIASKDGKTGLIGNNNEVIIDFDTWIITKDPGGFLITKNNLRALKDYSGKLVVEFGDYEIVELYYNTIFKLISHFSKKQAYYNHLVKNPIVASSFKYDRLEPWGWSLLRAYTETDGWFIINAQNGLEYKD